MGLFQRQLFVHVDKELSDIDKCEKFMLTNSIDNVWWNNDDVTPMFDGDSLSVNKCGDYVLVGNTKYLCDVAMGWSKLT